MFVTLTVIWWSYALRWHRLSFINYSRLAWWRSLKRLTKNIFI
jgi:hypothetical protein